MLNKLQKTLSTLLLFIILTQLSLQASKTVVSLKQLSAKINEIRGNPQAQAIIIKTKILDKINDSGLHTGWNLKYQEGKAAVQEAIDYLKSKQPVGSLKLDQGLTRSAYEHSKFQIEEAKAMTHTGPNGEGIGDRVRKFNTWGGGGIYENIVSSSSIWNTAELVCFAWIIDDGVSSRGHRKNFFATDASKMGIGIYNYEGGAKDRVTLILGGNEISDCTGCASFTEAQKKEMCWTSYEQNLDTCDTDGSGAKESGNEGGNTKENENKSGGETNVSFGKIGSLFLQGFYVLILSFLINV